MNIDKHRDLEARIANAIPHNRVLTELTKAAYLATYGKPMQLIGVDAAARREREWARARMWVCIVDNGGSPEEADMVTMGALWLEARWFDSGKMDLDGELLAA